MITKIKADNKDAYIVKVLLDCTGQKDKAVNEFLNTIQEREVKLTPFIIKENGEYVEYYKPFFTKEEIDFIKSELLKIEHYSPIIESIINKL